MDEHTFVDTFVNGARDLLGVALIIGVARGIVVIMDAGKITDTILHAREAALGGLAHGRSSSTGCCSTRRCLSFLVPSSSGLAVLSMPILAPLSDFAGVARSLVVTAYQSANGWVNLFNPTFAVVMGGLAIGRVSYDRWLRFVWPLLRDPRDHRRGGAQPRGDEFGRARRGPGARRGAGELRRWPRGRAWRPSGGLGLVACTALVVGNMIGSGIFLLPASLAAFGPISLVGWTVTSLGALVLAVIFGRLSRIVTKTGGPYAYTEAGFGEFAGFIIAWGYWIALWTGNAGVAVALAGYVGFLFPGIAASQSASLAVALIAIWTLTLVNIRGVAEAGRRAGRHHGPEARAAGADRHARLPSGSTAPTSPRSTPPASRTSPPSPPRRR